ncbi:MAG: hypothetical protein LE180_02935, partial [Endomicrobium sp.]|uniref:hypothetical protein n=1 Tax=Candidatus Endomicrobiellum pyrsonymphae TaxID=1408203 RepID=UPI00357CD282|nr:hypothetical protein [Endomicrobium sp.]
MKKIKKAVSIAVLFSLVLSSCGRDSANLARRNDDNIVAGAVKQDESEGRKADVGDIVKGTIKFPEVDNKALFFHGNVGKEGNDDDKKASRARNLRDGESVGSEARPVEQCPIDRAEDDAELWMFDKDWEAWLKKEEGRAWLKTKEGKKWLKGAQALYWISHEDGQDWLETFATFFLFFIIISNIFRPSSFFSQASQSLSNIHNSASSSALSIGSEARPVEQCPIDRAEDD